MIRRIIRHLQEFLTACTTHRHVARDSAIWRLRSKITDRSGAPPATHDRTVPDGDRSSMRTPMRRRALVTLAMIATALLLSGVAMPSAQATVAPFGREFLWGVASSGFQ